MDRQALDAMQKLFGLDALDLLGVKRTVEPNEEQCLVMKRIADVSGLLIVQDRVLAFQMLGPKTNFVQGFFVQKRYVPIVNDAIVLNTDANHAYWYHVLFHELAHATGMTQHLNREGLGPDKTPKTSIFEELIADATAMRLMEYFGFATDETRARHMHYIAEYTTGLNLMGSVVNPVELDAKVSEAFDFIVSKWVTQDFFQKDSSIAA